MIDKKKIVWAIISFCIAVGSIFLVINQSKTFKAEVLISSMLAMDLKWLILAVVSMLGFIWFEGLAIIRIAKALGVNREQMYAFQLLLHPHQADSRQAHIL